MPVSEKIRNYTWNSSRKTEDASALFPNLGCIIMASGLARRFGSNKTMANFHGKPMILWTLENTRELYGQRLVVTRHQEVARLCQEMDIAVILHDLPGRNDTIRLGIEALHPLLRGCVFFPCDQPLLQRNTIIQLTKAFLKDDHAFYRLAFEDTVGMPVCFPAWSFEELCHLPEKKGGGFLLKKYPAQVHTVAAQDAYELYDIDTAADLTALDDIKIK